MSGKFFGFKSQNDLQRIASAVKRVEAMPLGTIGAYPNQRKSPPSSGGGASPTILCTVTGTPIGNVYPVRFLDSEGELTTSVGYALPTLLHLSQTIPYGTVFVGFKIASSSIPLTV